MHLKCVLGAAENLRFQNLGHTFTLNTYFLLHF